MSNDKVTSNKKLIICLWQIILVTRYWLPVTFIKSYFDLC